MARHYSESRKKAKSNSGNQNPIPENSNLSHVIAGKLLPIAAGPPRTEEDKHDFFVNLVRLHCGQRLTAVECANRMGVSERSIRSYMAEPLYKEIQEQLIADSKQSGHLMISEVIPSSIDGLFSIAQDTNVSPFVRYKCYAELLNYAGYNEPQEESRTDSRSTVSQFMKEVEAKRQQQQPVYNIQNLNITPDLTDKGKVVDSIPENIPPELHQYYSQVLPGGKLPESFRTEHEPSVSGIIRKRNGNPKIVEQYTNAEESVPEEHPQEAGDE